MLHHGRVGVGRGGQDGGFKKIKWEGVEMHLA